MASTGAPVIDTVDCLIQGRSLLKHPSCQTCQGDDRTPDVLPDLPGGGYRVSLTMGAAG